eukprot:TRINITY_DN67285_c4_g2_i1.p1 TRINITY_DN67285_c4_g2~~TRINITY_DN67285_c4_g2_i1.p1  ORF type:complete len:103 (-),score=0.16 TRINITY_DN67285_c4_g2_i1:994-1302(-)
MQKMRSGCGASFCTVSGIFRTVLVGLVFPQPPPRPLAPHFLYRVGTQWKYTRTGALLLKHHLDSLVHKCQTPVACFIAAPCRRTSHKQQAEKRGPVIMHQTA